MRIPTSLTAILAYFLHFTSSQIINYENNKVLSRTRRLAVPAFNGWQFKTQLQFLLEVPLEGVDTKFEAKLPFEHVLDISKR